MGGRARGAHVTGQRMRVGVAAAALIAFMLYIVLRAKARARLQKG